MVNTFCEKCDTFQPDINIYLFLSDSDKMSRFISTSRHLLGNLKKGKS